MHTWRASELPHLHPSLQTPALVHSISASSLEIMAPSEPGQRELWAALVCIFSLQQCEKAPKPEPNWGSRRLPHQGSTEARRIG